MTKKELCKQVSDNTSINQRAVEIIFQEALNVMAKAFASHENIYLRGFATFNVAQTPAKKARDIKAGKTIEIPARYTVRMKPANDLKQSMNAE